MGCDIHAWVQYRVKGASSDDSWQDWSGEMHWDRWYALFGRMAGLRDPDVEAIVEPRGVPGGFWSVDIIEDGYHTPSWLTLEEFATVAAEYPCPDVDATLAAMRSLEANGQEVRIVFAFDS